MKLRFVISGFKVLQWVTISLVILLLIMYLLLRLSSVQTYLAKQLAAFASQKAGVEIQIGKLDISDFITIKIEDLSIRDHHDSLFLKSNSIFLHISPRDLLYNNLYVFDVQLDSTFVAMIEYKGENEINLLKIINYFIPESSDTTSSEFGIFVENFHIHNSFFALDLQNMDSFEGMDYAHLNIDEINLQIKGFTIRDDSLMGNITQFSFEEKCGFRVDSLIGKALVCPRTLDIENFILRANSTALNAHLRLEYSQWTDWTDFIDKVKFNSQIDSSKIYISDLKYFATSLAGVDNLIYATAGVKGSIANLKINGANLGFGQYSGFIGDISLMGLPEFDQTFMRLMVEDASIQHGDLTHFKLPDNQSINFGEEVDRLGIIKIKGRFTGFYYDFVSNADFKTDLGRFFTDISMQPAKQGNDFAYAGKLKATNFDLGKLLNNNYLGKLTMDMKMAGQGLSSSLSANYEIKFPLIEIGGSAYDKLHIWGNVANKNVTAEIISLSDNFKLHTKGYFNFSDSLPHLQLAADVKNARVNRLLLDPNDTLGEVSLKINLDLKGDKLDNIAGFFMADSLIYRYKSKVYESDTIYVNSVLDQNNLRQVELQSPYLNAHISGFSKFSDFPVMLALLMNNIVPSIVDSNAITAKDPLLWRHNLQPHSEHFKFDLLFGKTTALSEILMPDFLMADGTRIKGNYDFYADSLDFSFTSNSLTYADFSVRDVDLKVNKLNAKMEYIMHTSFLRTLNSIKFDSLQLQGKLEKDTLDFLLNYGKENQYLNAGMLEGQLILQDTSVFDLKLRKGFFYVNDSLWNLKPNAIVNYGNHHIKVQDFEISTNDNGMLVSGEITDNPADALQFHFSKFNISLIDFLTKNYNTDLDGYVTGTVELSNIWNQPSFLSDFSISNLALNGVDLNSADIKTTYFPQSEAVVIDMILNGKEVGLKSVDLGGYFYPYREADQFDVEVRLKKFPLNSIEEYLSSFSSKLEGSATGNLRLKGNLSQPILLGSINTDIKDIKIDYTNVHYSIDDHFVFTPDYFGFVNAKAKDKDNNDIDLTMKLKHKFFQDFNLIIEASPNKAQLLNTTENDNELFYGKANGVGKFVMEGSFDELSLKLDLSPTGDSYMAIPINSQMMAEETDFISFVVKDSSLTNNSASLVEESSLKFDMDMNMNITPTTRVELVMDKKVGDVISARGSGKMKISYDKNGNLNMYGNYIIEKGNYLFTMQNIINKRFVIDPGSSIVWDGNLEDAQINLKAIYHTDAKLWDLLQQIDSSQAYKKPSKVNCIINITGNLYNPSISFDIALPEESIATRELVNRLLSIESTGNAEELNKNFLSLLVLGFFQPPSGYDAGSNPNAFTNNATELVAEQVSNLLNQISDEVEIGMAWNAGDNVTTQEVALALSYSMLNDRLIIDGKFGTGGGSTSTEANRRIVGDVNVEYKLTEDGRIRAKVFNRTNYYDPISRPEPYTQGVGIAFRKDFDNFSDLFVSKKKRLEQQKLLESKEADETKKKETMKVPEEIKIEEVK